MLATVLLGLLVSGPLQAAEDATRSWGEALANELMSPYCPGRALPDCPSPQAAELRQWIVAQAHAGRSRDDVMRQLLERFGEQMLQKPRARGFALTAYGMPIAGVVAGGLLLALFLRRQTASRRSRAEQPATLLADAEIARLVDEEFQRARDEA